MDEEEKSNLAAASGVLAGLVLDKITINKLLREEIMKESVIYQEIYATGEASGEIKGRREGEIKGRREGETHLVIRQLKRRFGEISENLTEQLRQLSVEELENLGEALLDFQKKEDLVKWLNQEIT